MTPATDYLVRSGLAKSWFSTPCSLFLTGSKGKVVVTVADEYKPSDHFSVKHWAVNGCERGCVLPPMRDFRVHKSNIFTSQHAVLLGHSLIPYQSGAILSFFNRSGSPISKELLDHFCDSETQSITHKRFREAWLWESFVECHVEWMWEETEYITGRHGTQASLAESQQVIVRNKHRKHWKYWQLWRKHLLHVPGEFVFSKEYRMA